MTLFQSMRQGERGKSVFVDRGLRARESARKSGEYHSASAVHAELQQRLDVRRKFAAMSQAVLTGSDSRPVTYL